MRRTGKCEKGLDISIPKCTSWTYVTKHHIAKQMNLKVLILSTPLTTEPFTPYAITFL